MIPARTERAIPESFIALGVGLVLSPILTATPLLQYVAWFLASLFHESGHCVVALLTGHSALPAIRLDGHAAATHGHQHGMLVWATWIGLGFLTWKLRARLKFAIPLAVLTLAYPALAWTGAGEILHLSGGHMGELAFASYALICATTVGYTNGLPERIAHALLGFYLVGRNVALFVGLATDAGARAVYHGNGSFGLTNDLIRIAEHVNWSLEGVAICFAALAFATAPVSIFCAYLYLRSTREEPSWQMRSLRSP